MSSLEFDVVAIGNAIVDVISRETDDFITEHGLAKGTMSLVDSERAAALYRSMSPASETSGGSAANTAVGVVSMGGRSSYIGKVRDDQLGEVFGHDIRAAGVHFAVPPAPSGDPTARCLVVVTPDAVRTMSTCLGIAGLLHPDDIDREIVAASRVLFCEGYIWDVELTKQAIRTAIEIARAADRRISFTLSDPFCVKRHHAEWLTLVDDTIDILFGNEAEICALYECDDFDTALRAVRGRCEVVVLTRSAKGSVVVTSDEVIEVPAEPVAEVVDTTGAGDLYAAGFLYGYTNGADLATCARFGSVAAAEVISHMGARPGAPLSSLLGR